MSPRSPYPNKHNPNLQVGRAEYQRGCRCQGCYDAQSAHNRATYAAKKRDREPFTTPRERIEQAYARTHSIHACMEATGNTYETVQTVIHNMTRAAYETDTARYRDTSQERSA